MHPALWMIDMKNQPVTILRAPLAIPSDASPASFSNVLGRECPMGAADSSLLTVDSSLLTVSIRHKQMPPDNKRDRNDAAVTTSTAVLFVVKV
jgi:hypothetical protein